MRTWGYRSILGLFALAIFCLQAGCSQSSLSSGTSLPSSVIGKNFSSKTLIVAREGNETPETTLMFLNSPQANEALKFPATIVKGTYGNRTNPAIPNLMNLFVKSAAIEGNFPNGDYFFEAPVLGPVGEINSVTTALSLWTRYRFNEVPSISRNTWVQLVQMVEAQCTNCIQKTTSEILSLIQGDTILSSNLDLTIRNGSPVSLSVNSQGVPDVFWVYSDPAFAPGSMTNSPLMVIKEDTSVEVNLLFLKPSSSTTKIFADQWTAQKNSSTYQTQVGHYYRYTFDYSSAGLHTITASKSLPSGLTQFTYQYDVGNTNRSPIFASGTRVTMRAQKENHVLIPVSTVADPDHDGVNFTLAGATSPTDNIYGLTASGGELVWTPIAKPGHPDNQLGLHRVILIATDNNPDPKSISGEIEIEVVADRAPQLTTSGDWTLSEGVASHYNFTVQDADGDRICLKADTGGMIINNSLPALSGSVTFTPLATDPSDQPPCYTVLGGSRAFQAHLTPSFMQTLGGPSSLDIKIIANYSITDGYVELSPAPEATVKLNFINVDDPPVWQTLPDDMITLSENASFTASGGWASDATLNSTAVTFYLVQPNSVYCRDMISGLTTETGADGSIYDKITTFTSSPSRIQIAGTPGYSTAPACTFRIRAVDARGLYTDSEVIQYNIDNVNRPVCWYYDGTGTCPGTDPYPNVTVHIDERGKFTQTTVVNGAPLTAVENSLNLSHIFRDPDQGDRITFSCVDCASKGLVDGSYVIMDKTDDNGSGTFAWYPGYGASTSIGTITLTFQAVDEVGPPKTKTVTIIIDATPAPMVLNLRDPLSIPVSSGSTVVIQEPPELPTPPNPLSASTYHVSLRPATADAINVYPYQMKFVLPTMRPGAAYITNIVNNCDPGGSFIYAFVANQLTMTNPGSGVSTTKLPACASGLDFDVVYNLDNKDGDSGSTALNYKIYPDYSISVLRIDGGGLPDIHTSRFFSWDLKAQNTNRSIKTIGMSTSGAVAAKNDTSTWTTDFNVSLTASQVLSNTGGAIAARTINLYASDLDGTNDFFTYTHTANSKLFGNSFTQSPSGNQAASVIINGGCFTSAAGIAKINFAFTVTDGRGRQVTRNVRLSLTGVAFYSSLPTCR